jgi:hypothetical protein
MKSSSSLILCLVLLGGAGLYITRLSLENYGLKVELATLRSRAAQPVKLPAPVAAAPAAAAAQGREVFESARQLMIDALAEEKGSEKKLWLRVDPRDREASTFAGQIASVFREQGWDVKQLDNEGMRFKPGLLLLVGAEEDPPSYVLAAQKALEAVGEDISTGRGYLAYYESKKKESPQWQGTRFAPDQAYVLLVGRRPEAQPAE